MATVLEYNGIKLIDDPEYGCIRQSPILDVIKYYEDDRFYNSHSPSDWMRKVRKEHRRGLWKPAYSYQQSLMSDSEYLLDVGCGAGWFVEHWDQRGGTGFGIEPSATARLQAPISVYGNIHESLDVFPHMGFGWNVRMSLVLEHIPYPKKFLARYIPFVGRQGSLMVIVPNEFSPLQTKIDYNGFVSKVHVNYFTPCDLRNMLYDVFGKAGYGMTLYETATFPMELFVLMGINYIGNDSLGRKCHMFRLNFEKALGNLAFKLYKNWYDKNRWGRELVFVAKGE